MVKFSLGVRVSGMIRVRVDVEVMVSYLSLAAGPDSERRTPVNKSS